MGLATVASPFCFPAELRKSCVPFVPGRTSHVFIDPDSNGAWQVTWRIVRHNHEVDEVPTIRIVERKDVDGQVVLVCSKADGQQRERL